MSDKNKSFRLCDNDDTLTENERFRQRYPPLEVPTSIYKMIFINKYTSMEEMNLLINHVQSCNQFTIDTESEKSNNELALIQIQTLSRRLPTFVIFIELAHLPTEHSHMYVKIKKFFELVFRLGNELYSWGDMTRELYPIKDYNLIKWPLLPSMIDIQPYFDGWYERARTLQESRCPKHHSHDANVINDKPSTCECYERSPYNQGQLWSLQKALIYSTHLFIDKSCRMNNWAGGLTNNNTKLSSSRRKNMISYAAKDVLATTILIRPILEDWSFDMFKKIKIDDLYVQFKSTPPPQLPQKIKKIKNNINTQKFISALFEHDDLEPISDDEIYLNQLMEPVKYTTTQDVEQISEDELPSDEKLSTNKIQLMINEKNDLPDDNIEEKFEEIKHLEQTPPERKPKSSHKRRSRESKQKRNKKRNKVHRMRRFRYTITRPMYYKFKMPMVNQILKEHNIKYVHPKEVDKQLVIGMKHKELKQRYEDQIFQNMFDYKQYQNYQRQHHQHQRRHKQQQQH
jgi:hypothetical protein